MAWLARWCFRHRYLVIFGWIVGLVVLGALSGAAGTAYTDSSSLPGTESTKALDLLRESFPSQSGDTDTIVWRVDDGSVTDQPVRSRITAMLQQVGHSSHVTGVVSPYTPQGTAQLSKDGRTAYATVNFDRQAQDLPTSAFTHVIDTAKAARDRGLQVELGGNGIFRTEAQPPSTTTAIAMAAAAVVLFLAFGSLLATVLPLLTAILALGVATASIGLVAHALDISPIAPTFAALIGLGVGIDYALFVVTRHRNAIKAGTTPLQAAATAMHTAGRAVLFAGGTVCVALLGLLALRVNSLNTFAIPGALTVVVTMAAATTLLPALLGVIGMRVLSRRERRRLAAQGPHDRQHAEGFWARWPGIVRRRPLLWSTLAVVVVAVLAIPLFWLRLGASDQGNHPRAWTTRKAYDLLAEGFGPGFNGPLQLVAQTPGGPGDQPALDTLAGNVRATGGVASVSPALSNQDGSVAVVQVIPTSAPQDKATTELLSRLREVVPQATRGSDLTVRVGGITATFDDYASVLTGKLPLFVAVIVALGCLLLLVAFRSLLVPATAAVMNLLATGAVFGVITAVFQWGWGARLLGLDGAGPIDPLTPLVMIAILFGLSMDYQVFLVSRMHETWSHTRSNPRAVSAGLADTGRVITAAAAIMVLVFGSFALTGERAAALFGIGLAAAVLIDAFVLRTVLLPAAMHLFGVANWWLPRWLDRTLPQLSVEPADQTTPVQTGRPVAEPVP